MQDDTTNNNTTTNEEQNIPQQNKNEQDSDSDAASYTPGACGLRNVGNTCYLNSGMQALSHIRPLRDFFLQEQIVKQVKEKNAQSKTSRSKLALLYAICMEKLWSGRATCLNIAPLVKEFWHMHPRFGGYSQQVQ